VYDSLACSYSELGDTTSAFDWLDKALKIHFAHDPSKRARTEAIYAMTYLRAEEPDKSLEKVRTYWGLLGLTQDDVVKSRYPKHSGDIVLMSRIKWKQGHSAEAQELASRSVLMRRGTYGEKGGPRVADSTFLVARMLCEKAQYVLAAKLLREIIDMCGNMEEMRPHLARALWFLAGVEERLGEDEAAWKDLRRRAEEEREKIEDREWPDEDSDDSFMKLVGWLLW
jgi:tetratricopeptide (TPR) repeat protein